MLGNFLGDFVKGSNLDHLPKHIAKGIRLHRKIDSFTDNHPLVIDLRQQFPSSLRRMSGVVIDIYFDHLLCRHWPVYSQTPLEEVLDIFYAQLLFHDLQISSRFSKVKQGLIDYKWLQDYQQLAACTRAFYQIEKRLQHKIQFADEAETFLHKNQPNFEKTFLEFYPLLVQFSKKGAAII